MNRRGIWAVVRLDPLLLLLLFPSSPILTLDIPFELLVLLPLLLLML